MTPAEIARELARAVCHGHAGQPVRLTEGELSGLLEVAAEMALECEGVPVSVEPHTRVTERVRPPPRSIYVSRDALEMLTAEEIYRYCQREDGCSDAA